MRDLERLELALRRALEMPNPHSKPEVVLKELVNNLFDMNNYYPLDTERKELDELRNK